MYSPDMAVGWVDPWVGLGWVKKTGPTAMSDVAGSLSAPYPYQVFHALKILYFLTYWT